MHGAPDFISAEALGVFPLYEIFPGCNRLYANVIERMEIEARWLATLRESGDRANSGDYRMGSSYRIQRAGVQRLSLERLNGPALAHLVRGLKREDLGACATYSISGETQLSMVWTGQLAGTSGLRRLRERARRRGAAVRFDRDLVEIEITSIADPHLLLGGCLARLAAREVRVLDPRTTEHGVSLIVEGPHSTDAFLGCCELMEATVA